MYKYEFETQKDKGDKALTTYVNKKFTDGWELVSQTTAIMEKAVGLKAKGVYREMYFVWRKRNS